VTPSLNITLPLLDLSERIFYEQMIPMALMPNGAHTLVVCFLENQESSDYFVKACFDIMECALQEMPEQNQAMYEGYVNGRVRSEALDICLSLFHDHYTDLLSHLFAHRPMRLVRVLSYQLCSGVCVELKEDCHGAAFAG
jgi:hypothetical protein